MTDVGLNAANDETSEAASRHAGVDYRLEGVRTRIARRRAARRLKVLDRRFVRLAKQVRLTTAWRHHLEQALAGQDMLAGQPTTFLLHAGRKAAATIAEGAFTLAALDLAGIPNRVLRMILAVALAALLILLGQTIARTLKRAHLSRPAETGRGTVDPPTRWDWGIFTLCVLFLVAFAAALTVLRDHYTAALEKAQAAAVAANQGQLTAAAPVHSVPGWVLAILALVAPLLAIISEYSWYHPHAHRLRRSLRLYAWNARKLRHALMRCAGPVARGRRALLAYDNRRSRAFRMKHVIHAAHGGTPPSADDHRFHADEPIRQLRQRIAWYDAVAAYVRQALLGPPANTLDADTAADQLERLLAQGHSANGSDANHGPVVA